MMQSRNGKCPSDAFFIANSMFSSISLAFAMSLQDHVMLLQMYRQCFCTIDEGRLILYKHDFLPLFEYKFPRNMVKLVHL